MDDTSLDLSSPVDRGADPMPTTQSGAWREVRTDARHALSPDVWACVFCGCDLYPDPGAPVDEAWFHFAPVGGKRTAGR